MRLSLNGDDWQFNDYVGEDWRWRGAHHARHRNRRPWQRGRVPGSVLHDLWQAGEVPNPYFERNSLLCEWAAGRTWVYRRSFAVPAEAAGQRAQLHCLGVDYAAEFFLNDEFLGTHAGMHTPAVFEVGHVLVPGAENFLAVVIEAAPVEQPQVGRTSRVRTHKSRMTYWWDFCPRLLHQGIWDDVYLDFTGPVRIDDVCVRPELSDDLAQAEVPVAIALNAPQAAAVEVRVTLRHAGQPVAEARKQHALAAGDTPVRLTLGIEPPRLWWPNGYGEQPLYEADVTVTLVGQAEPSAARRVSFGFRRLRLVPNDTPDPAARPYTLEVNGRRVYLNGWNWVPIDALYGVPRPEKLARLLRLATLAHVNLLRVWGGGLIEREAFYDHCDRLGLLVWQEFTQSSSGIDNHPSDSPEWVEALTREAERVIPLRRNHPALAVWCGGNELQTGAEQPADERHPALAALRAVVERLDPGRPWLPTSPSGRLFSNSLENIARDPQGLHDVHGPWEHQGLVDHFELYNAGTALLHSEFGVEGITNPRALDAVITPEHQWPVSLHNPYWFHLAAWWLKAPRWREVFGELPDVPTAVRALQFLQADGLRYAVEANRRRQWRCSGSLPWQLNESYPNPACTSAVDYFAVPKPAYYSVARAYAPVTVTAQFPAQAWTGRSTFTAEVFGSQTGLAALEGLTLEARLVEASGRELARHTQPAALAPNGTTRLAALSWPLAEGAGAIFFLDLALSDAMGAIIARNRYPFSRGPDFAPLLAPAPTSLAVDVGTEGDNWHVTAANTGQHTAFFVWLEDPRPLDAPGYACFADNHFCLLPGEQRTIAVWWQGVPAADRHLSLAGWNTGGHEVREVP